MRLRSISAMLLLALLASACGAPAAAAPTVSLEAVQSTSLASAFTALAETHAVQPTETLAPPTATDSPTRLPTDTLTMAPTLAESPTPSLTPTLLPSLTATGSDQPTTAASDACNKPLLAWQGPSVKLLIRYEYSPQSKDDKVVLSLWAMTDQQECGFLSSLSTGPVGNYSAVAYVDGKKDFKVFGGFRLNGGSWEIIIRNDVIVAKGGCYPNC